MFSPFRSIFRLSQSQKILWFPPEAVSHLPVLQKLCSNRYQYQKFSTSTVKLKDVDDDIPSTFSKYEPFSEETAPVILDVEEERQKITPDEKPYDVLAGINLERGVNGVFEISEIVELLKREKGKDIFVVKIPPEYNYADYMAIASAKSKRHMLAISEFIRRVYKLKVGASGQIPMVEGENSSIWMALDLGNIILHVFSREGRELYDLESLWSLGKEYDAHSQRKSTLENLSTDYAQILARLSPNS